MLSKIMDFWMNLLGIKAPVVEPEPVVEVKEEPAPVEKPKRKAKAKAKVEEPAQDYSKLSKAELVKAAEARGIQVNMRMKKDEMIAALNA